VAITTEIGKTSEISGTSIERSLLAQVSLLISYTTHTGTFHASLGLQDCTAAATIVARWAASRGKLNRASPQITILFPLYSQSSILPLRLRSPSCTKEGVALRRAMAAIFATATATATAIAAVAARIRAAQTTEMATTVGRERVF
jgi:hypothetical protein